MGLTMGERRALTEQVARRYGSAAKKDKAVILSEFVEATGYSRKYAIHLLSSWGLTRVVRIDGQMVKLVVGRPRRPKPLSRPRRYDQEVPQVPHADLVRVRLHVRALRRYKPNAAARRMRGRPMSR